MATARRRALGQHFLADGRIARRIVDAFAPRPCDQVLEVGPGEGALTELVAGRVERLVAVELDAGLAAGLDERFADREEVRVVAGDILGIRLAELPFEPRKPVRVLSNLPYASATAILRRLLEERARIEDMVVMVQREVAERMAALPSTRGRGYLSVLVQLLTRVEPLLSVGPAAFRPRPKVHSAVLRLRPRLRPAAGPEDPAPLLDLVSAGFRARRKTLHRNLADAGRLARSRWEAVRGRAGLAQTARAEELDLEEWGRLLEAMEGERTPAP